jgi:putative FmdB family regulatory protein
MPLYTYKCPECDARTTLDHPMMDERKFKCEACSNTPTLIKLPGVGAVSFKGGGWGKDAR